MKALVKRLYTFLHLEQPIVISGKISTQARVFFNSDAVSGMVNLLYRVRTHLCKGFS